MATKSNGFENIPFEQLNSAKKFTMFLRSAFDLGIFITALVYCFRLEHLDRSGGSKTPFLFDVYHLRPYQGLKNITNFYKTGILEVDMSTATGITKADFTTALRQHSGCVIGATPRPPMCATCVDDYADKIHDAVNLLDDDTANAANALDVAAITPLVDELEGCIGRTGGTRTVHYMYKTNPWLQFVLWTGLAMVYTTVQWVLTWTSEWNKAGNLSWGRLAPIISFAAVVTLFVVLLFLPKKADEFQYDLHFSIFQILIAGLAFGIILFNFQHDEKTHVLAFGSYMVAAAPSIAVILNTTHAWLEYDMLNFSATVLGMFFAMCLVDDLLSVYWARAKNSKEDEAHVHLHSFICVTSLFVIIVFRATNLPLAPDTDPLNGSLLFAVFLIFAVTYAIAPTILYELRKEDAMQIVMYKELAELIFRIVVFIVLSFLYTKGAGH